MALLPRDRRAAMAAQPDKQMLVLCGYTQGAGECQVVPRLRGLTGDAEDEKPRAQWMIELPEASSNLHSYSTATLSLAFDTT